MFTYIFSWNYHCNLLNFFLSTNLQTESLMPLTFDCPMSTGHSRPPKLQTPTLFLAKPNIRSFTLPYHYKSHASISPKFSLSLPIPWKSPNIHTDSCPIDRRPSNLVSGCLVLGRDFLHRTPEIVTLSNPIFNQETKILLTSLKP